MSLIKCESFSREAKDYLRVVKMNLSLLDFFLEAEDDCALVIGDTALVIEGIVV